MCSPSKTPTTKPMSLRSNPLARSLGLRPRRFVRPCLICLSIRSSISATTRVSQFANLKERLSATSARHALGQRACSCVPALRLFVRSCVGRRVEAACTGRTDLAAARRVARANNPQTGQQPHNRCTTATCTCNRYTAVTVASRILGQLGCPKARGEAARPSLAATAPRCHSRHPAFARTVNAARVRASPASSRAGDCRGARADRGLGAVCGDTPANEVLSIGGEPSPKCAPHALWRRYHEVAERRERLSAARIARLSCRGRGVDRSGCMRASPLQVRMVISSIDCLDLAARESFALPRECPPAQLLRSVAATCT